MPLLILSTVLCLLQCLAMSLSFFLSLPQTLLHSSSEVFKSVHLSLVFLLIVTVTDEQWFCHLSYLTYVSICSFDFIIYLSVHLWPHKLPIMTSTPVTTYFLYFIILQYNNNTDTSFKLFHILMRDIHMMQKSVILICLSYGSNCLEKNELKLMGVAMLLLVESCDAVLFKAVKILPQGGAISEGSIV